jgi:hypothetical protein
LKGGNGKIPVTNREACTEWNYDTNGDDNLYHRSVQQTRSLIPMYRNEWRINETKYLPTVSTTCGVKTEHAARLLHVELNENSVM